MLLKKEYFRWEGPFGNRLTCMMQFNTLEWSLEPEGCEKISLLNVAGNDPFQQSTADKVAVAT